jgi:two-component sensor histidine kinase
MSRTRMTDQTEGQGVARLRRQQAALAAFGSYAFHEPVLLKVLTEAARVCAEGLGVPYCKVCRYRETEDDLLIEAGYGWHAGVIGLVVSRADITSPQGRAYITGKPVILQNLAEADDVELPPFYDEHGIVSTVDVIIKGIDGEPYGVLEIDSPVQHTYDEHDIDFLTGFANVLAEAVATFTRGDLLRQTVAKMEALVIEKDKLLAERVVMAEELKHRVRNNLQLVSGMLAAHLRNYTTHDEKASLNAIVRRVMTLAEVYEQLLGTGMARTVDFGEYLKALCVSLPGLQKDPNLAVDVTCDVCELMVDLDTVTALGMVVAELVSNSYEHALPNAEGTIQVSLRRSDIGDGVLVVKDNGTGFTEEPGSKRHGVGLVRRLVQQVQGTAELRSDHGSVWTVRFPVSSPTEVAVVPKA